jgi:hypothetical protein
MIISHIYEVNMRFLFVQLANVPNPVQVEAAKVEEDEHKGLLLAKDAQGNIVGKFPDRNVVAWWTQD